MIIHGITWVDLLNLPRKKKGRGGQRILNETIHVLPMALTTWSQTWSHELWCAELLDGKIPHCITLCGEGRDGNGHGTHPRALKIQSVMNAWCRWWRRYRDEGQELAVTELAVSVPWDWRKKQPRANRAFPPLLWRHDWWLPLFCAHPCRCRHFLLSQSTLNLQHELKQWKIYAWHG